MSAKCETCSVRNRGLCAALTQNQLGHLAAISRKRAVACHQTIFREGDDATYFATVVSGVVKLVKTTSGGADHIISLAYPTDFLGHMFKDERGFSAVAASDVELCVYPKAGFHRLLSTHAGIEHKLFEFTVRELDTCRDWMLLLSHKAAYERVASLFFLMARRQGNAEDAARSETAHFDVPLARSEIADYLGLTVETVSRQITRLKRKGIITLPSIREVHVPSLELLSAVAQMDECDHRGFDWKSVPFASGTVGSIPAPALEVD